MPVRDTYRARYVASVKRAHHRAHAIAAGTSEAEHAARERAEFARQAHEALYGGVQRCPGCGVWLVCGRGCVTCTLLELRRTQDRW